MKIRRKPYKRIALALSFCMIVIWGMLGTGASLAWFSDTSEEIENIFHIANFDLEVSHRLENGTYEQIDGRTDIFDENALYEPGYVQTVYLKVKNTGSVPFDFNVALNVTESDPATNVYDEELYLHKHLRFGIISNKNETALLDSLKNRDLAKAIATDDLGDYTTNTTELGSEETMYFALVVRMPEEVGNEANYKGDKVPTVHLGLIVKADQQKN